jgi:diguanylate cyclase (GGDEF)-like protein/PAS domain S-box-containing protein
MAESSNNSKLLPKLSRETLTQVFDMLDIGLWDWNANTSHVYRSAGWYRMLLYDIKSLDNTVITWERVIHPDDFARVMQHFDQFITKQSDEYCVRYRCQQQNGDYLWVEDKAVIVDWNENGTVARVIGAHHNISAQKYIEEKGVLEMDSLQKVIDRQTAELNKANKELSEKISLIEHSANTDRLTNIANRFHFDNKIKDEIARVKRFNEPLSIILFDLDKFKAVNDSLGHAEGDKILVRVANILSDNLREIDLPVRWGGDEFLVLLVNSSIQQALLVAEELRLLISEDHYINKHGVTGSFGVASLINDETAENIVIRADKALYKAKKSGRNNVVIAGD